MRIVDEIEASPVRLLLDDLGRLATDVGLSGWIGD
jgi:hypothetical protein